jgi:hypothetical protein
VELEHLEIETRLIDEKFANAMGEYVTQLEVIGDPSRLRLIRNAAAFKFLGCCHILPSVWKRKPRG